MREYCNRGHIINGLNVYKRNECSRERCRICQMANTRMHAEGASQREWVHFVELVATEHRDIAVYAGIY